MRRILLVALTGLLLVAPSMGDSKRSDPSQGDSSLPKRLEDLMPKGSPPLDLDGYCPVALKERKQWQLGDVRFGAIHRGRTYLFESAAAQARFLKSPDDFSPAISGRDPYFAVVHGTDVTGKREHGVTYNGRVFLFATPDSRDKFIADPNWYIDALKQRVPGAPVD